MIKLKTNKKFTRELKTRFTYKKKIRIGTQISSTKETTLEI